MVWTGIGAVGAFLVGVLWLGEAAPPMRVRASAMSGGGIILIKISAV